VALLQDEAEAGEIGERRRERIVQVDAHLVRFHLLRALDEGQQRVVGNGVLLVGDEVQGVGDVVGIHRLARVELDVLSQLHLQRGRVDPRPLGRQQRFDLAGLGIDDDERVPGLVPDDDQLAGVQEEGIGDRVVAVGGPDQRVVLLAGLRRSRNGSQRDQGPGQGRTQTFHQTQSSQARQTAEKRSSVCARFARVKRCPRLRAQ
jgi:hypothetical protein